MYTTLTPELQNAPAKGKNPCWAHFGLHDTRWATREKLSFTVVKLKVMIKHDILTTSLQQTQNEHKNAPKITVFVCLASESPKIVAPVWEW